MAIDEPLIPAGLGLESDPDIYLAVKSLMLLGVSAAKDILDTAAPAIQLQMIRILLPRITGAISQGGGDKDEELKKMVAGLYDQVADAIATPEIVIAEEGS